MVDVHLLPLAPRVLVCELALDTAPRCIPPFNICSRFLRAVYRKVRFRSAYLVLCDNRILAEYPMPSGESVPLLAQQTAVSLVSYTCPKSVQPPTGSH